MTEPTFALGPGPSAMEVVPRAIADEIVAEATVTILGLEQELEDAQRAAAAGDAAADAEPLDEAAHFLLARAEALVSEAQAHRDRVIDTAWAEAATIIDAIPTPTNGHR